jgi:hypothetical protein
LVVRRFAADGLRLHPRWALHLMDLDLAAWCVEVRVLA